MRKNEEYRNTPDFGPIKVVHGLSAYELAVKNGFEGTEQEWLESLKGQGQTVDKDELKHEIIAELDIESGVVETLNKLNIIDIPIDEKRNVYVDENENAFIL